MNADLFQQGIARSVRRDHEAHCWLLTWSRDAIDTENRLAIPGVVDAIHWYTSAWNEAIIGRHIRLALNLRDEIIRIQPAGGVNEGASVQPGIQTPDASLGEDRNGPLA